MHSISSGAPFGEEQPDEVGLQLLPRDEVHAKALLQRQPDQIGEMTMMIYMTTIMVTMVTIMMMAVTMVTMMMMVVTMVTIMMMVMVHALLHRQQDQIGEKMEFNECKMERLCTIRWMNIQTNLIEGGTADIPTFVLILY